VQRLEWPSAREVRIHGIAHHTHLGLTKYRRVILVRWCVDVLRSFDVSASMYLWTRLMIDKGWQWATYATPAALLTCSDLPDTLPHWPDSHHRHPKNLRLLCTAAKAQRHGRVLGWHHLDPSSVALDGLSHRALRHIRPVWRFLHYHRFLRGQRPCRGAVHPDCFTKTLEGEEKCRAASLREVWRISDGDAFILSADHIPSHGRHVGISHRNEHRFSSLIGHSQAPMEL